MQEINLEKVNSFISNFERVIEKPLLSKSKKYYVGIDLGTAVVVLAILDENYMPVAGAYKYANVVKDGMIVDYLGAIDIVKDMKKELEKKLGVSLAYAAAALPPGTNELDGGVIKNVVSASGFILTNLLDEPTAANNLLDIKNGAVVDIGGGTTGISILKNGKVIKTDDEATGGIHFSLVIAGAKKTGLEDAEIYKRESKNHNLIIPIVKPVIEKIANIIKKQIKGFDLSIIALVGGSCLLKDIENIIEKEIGIPCVKPKNPLFATPLGIALSYKNKKEAG
ncbi:MAG: ethanolamine utilization protein EutJ [Clostridiales Family XIII bacterium]|jgi:ethanolamine utilization protein EutJ|nr:ethanolamine utilization protein EutJ [Clostridiales Family XIII bacterium]